ncbi:MAG TPA: hypothetical protein VHX52_07240 [Steroidobacteraceae bacterium]|jgi:hypothetical protein|nr:hypothetical protein [Steroidobacteraceae bacterium]
MGEHRDFGLNNFCLYSALVVLAACTAGCNGDLGSSGNGSSSSSTAASAAGVWSGTDSASGLVLTAFVNSNGQADFFRSDGVQFIGMVQVSGTTLQVALNGYTQFQSQFSDGSTYGVGTFNGTVSAGSSISGTLNFTTNNATASTSTWSLTFDSLYDTASSLGAISGNYTDNVAAVSGGADPLSGASVTISSAGVLYGQGSANDCVLNGTVTVGNSSYDLYEVSYTYENCTGTYAALNAVPFTGLAEINSKVSPAQILMTAEGESSGGVYYAIISQLSAT